jgi:hypothetical protein
MIYDNRFREQVLQKTAHLEDEESPTIISHMPLKKNMLSEALSKLRT